VHGETASLDDRQVNAEPFAKQGLHESLPVSCRKRSPWTPTKHCAIFGLVERQKREARGGHRMDAGWAVPIRGLKLRERGDDGR
jgi:hypothetical protein